MLLALVLAVLVGPWTVSFAGPAAAQPSSSGGSSTSTAKFLKLTLDSVTPGSVTTTSDSVLTVSGTVTNIGDRSVKDVSVRIQRAAAVATPSGLRSTLRLDQSNYSVNGEFHDVADQLSPGQRTQFTLRIGIRPGSESGSGDQAVTSSLDITDPGVYPLLLNVNGQPDYGGMARLDDARFLLPVLGLPPLPGGSDAKGPAAQAVPASTEAPVATTLIWPLADRPRVAAGVTGSADGKVLLTDDELAGELRSGGRLDQLLAALEAVVHPESPRGGPNLTGAICLAIDPDLLQTVYAMRVGYKVLASPSDPSGATRDGTGAQAAAAWLDRLRALAPSMCTVALPFAQVDLAALAAVHDPDLSARALSDPADIVDRILSVKSMRGVALPDSGSIDDAAGTLLAAHGYTSTVLADTAVAPADSRSAVTGSAISHGDGTTVRNTAAVASATDTATPETVRLPGITPPAQSSPGPQSASGSQSSGSSQPSSGSQSSGSPQSTSGAQSSGSPQPAPGSASSPSGSPSSAPGSPSSAPGSASSAPGSPLSPPEAGMRVTTFDIWSATALAAVGSTPPTPSFTPEGVRYDIGKDSRPARLQDALGAVSWLALNPDANRPRSLLLMPPQQWAANHDEAAALLDQLSKLVRSGLAVPRSFQDLLAAPPDPRPFDLDYLPDTADVAVPDQFVAPIQQQEHRLDDLLNALVEVPQQEPTPRAFLDPLREDLLRVLTLSDRTNPSAQADTVAQRRIDLVTQALDRAYGAVKVLPPGGMFTLASEQSPLLLVARNDLPVAVRVRFKIGAPAETKITDIGEQQLPAQGTRSFQIPSQVSDRRELAIPISLTTADGVPLGAPVSVRVRSNAYGQVLAIITACAGALLFLLAGRRLWRRFRGQPDPADEGLDPGKRRRLNRYLRARKRVLERQETQ
ncbi:hypothetical protein F6W96_41805 [Nocardia terpenica]|uniref:Glycoprotein n=2 Tax=Nocardia terpenica TaxID=455432 RepID=A0A6G9ZGN1_9NOCA|nr:hypothetical protein F6W96_41805 [Nocardia terpenica]